MAACLGSEFCGIVALLRLRKGILLALAMDGSAIMRRTRPNPLLQIHEYTRQRPWP
jgi:hypothetical protein